MKESSTRPICTQLTWLHVPSFHRWEYPVATSTTTARQGCNCATLPRFGFYKSYRSLKRSEMLLAGCFTRVARDIRAKRRYWGENAFNEQRGRHFRDASVRLGQIFLFEYWRKRIRLRIFDRSVIKGKGSCGQFGIILAKWIFNFFGGGGDDWSYFYRIIPFRWIYQWWNFGMKVEDRQIIRKIEIEIEFTF